jgi:hypothetical protein
LAAKELDKMWDGWTERMTASYTKTLDLLDEGRDKKAAEEFRTGYVQTVKKLYSEAAEIYPVRFSKVDEWCGWTRNLYRKTIKLDKELAKGSKGKKVDRMMTGLRQHFYNLHYDAKTLKAGDYVFALNQVASQKKPSIKLIKNLRKKLESAKASGKAKSDADGFSKAKKEWEGKMDTIMADDSISKKELEAMRKSTGEFCRAYGMQFE